MDMGIVRNGNLNIKIIRVSSCVMVLLTHFGSVLFPVPFLSTFFTYCAEGVRAFFILSGYLMCFSHELDEGHIIAYYNKRFRRILPIYLFVLFVFIILGVVKVIPWPVDETGLYWLRYFFFLSTIVPANDIYWTNLAMTWTVSYFLFFYLIAPIIYKVVNSYTKAWIAVFLAMICSKIIPDGFFEPVTGLYAFLLGVAVFYAIKEEKEYNNIIISGIIAFVLYVYGLAYPYGDSFLISIIIICVLKNRISLTFKIANKLIDFIDEHSYSIYLMQGLVITVISSCFGGMKSFKIAWMTLVITIVLAALFDKIQNKIIILGNSSHENKVY